MALPSSLQQTLTDVEAHFRRLNDQVSSLKRENQDMKLQLARIEMDTPKPMKVVEAFEGPDIPVVKVPPKIAFESSLPGRPDEELVTLDELQSTDLLKFEQNRIRKVDTQMVHDAVHIRKHMMNGEDEQGPTLASDKMRKLKKDPFEQMIIQETQPMFTRKNMWNLCFLSGRVVPDPCIKRFVNGLFFKSITMIAIAANTLYLGLVADNNVKNSYRRFLGDTVPKPSVIPDISFTAWFSVEILIKMAADRLDFFVGDEKYWNMFDMALVAEAIVGLFFEGSKLSFLRIFRVFRLVRVVKVVRSVKALARLRTMIFAILSSFVDLLWAFLVIVLIIFVFAIVFDNAVADYFDVLDRNNPVQLQDAKDMEFLFGNLIETMISLWSAVSGGNDWMNYGELLRKVPTGDLYFAIFNFYVAFCVVGMFNVVTGVFVDSAVCVRTGDEVVQGYLDDLRQTTEEIKGFFKEADMDGSGTLNWDEFQHHMQNPAVKAYFSGLDIDPEEAEIIFTILDGNKSQEIKIDDFVNGTMKLKGSASKLDLMALMYDQTRQSMKFDALCEFVEEELSEIKKRVMQAPKQVTPERHEERSRSDPTGSSSICISPSTSLSPSVRSGRMVRIETVNLPRALAIPRRR